MSHSPRVFLCRGCVKADILKSDVENTVGKAKIKGKNKGSQNG